MVVYAVAVAAAVVVPVLLGVSAGSFRQVDANIYNATVTTTKGANKSGGSGIRQVLKKRVRYERHAIELREETNFTHTHPKGGSRHAPMSGVI